MPRQSTFIPNAAIASERMKDSFVPNDDMLAGEFLCAKRQTTASRNAAAQQMHLASGSYGPESTFTSGDCTEEIRSSVA